MFMQWLAHNHPSYGFASTGSLTSSSFNNNYHNHHHGANASSSSSSNVVLAHPAPPAAAVHPPAPPGGSTGSSTPPQDVPATSTTTPQQPPHSPSKGPATANNHSNPSLTRRASTYPHTAKLPASTGDDDDDSVDSGHSENDSIKAASIRSRTTNRKRDGLGSREPNLALDSSETRARSRSDSNKPWTVQTKARANGPRRRSIMEIDRDTESKMLQEQERLRTQRLADMERKRPRKQSFGSSFSMMIGSMKESFMVKAITKSGEGGAKNNMLNGSRKISTQMGECLKPYALLQTHSPPSTAHISYYLSSPQRCQFSLSPYLSISFHCTLMTHSDNA